MPQIKFKHIISFSSQDKNHPAENLLKNEGAHKWKCEHSGEKQATAVVQLEKSSQIHSIDIGNEGSAFVEILVGRESASTDQDYQVILVASSFMTPLESRNGTNRNAVRMFGTEKLSTAVASQKWDRIKVVCTQPFNKNVSYGLSFLRINSPPTGKEEEKKEVGKKIGAFIIKPAEGDGITPGSVFASRGKEEKTDTAPPTGAAAMRAASKMADQAGTSRPDTSVVEKKIVKVTAPRPDLNKRKHDDEDDDDLDYGKASVPPLRKQSTSLSSSTSSYRAETPPPLKRTKSEPSKPSPAKIFGRLMEKVTFVLSGFQNPYRGELRDKAMEMGAVYKPDWSKDCTHLICAFSNTPKYQQVKGKGKIVTKAWVLDCHKQRKLLPWKKYRLGDADSPPTSSSEEDEPPPKLTKKRESPVTSKPPVKKQTPMSKKNDDIYGGDTDSGEDTEDELRRAKVKIAKESEKTKSRNPYGDSTDEDEFLPEKKSPKKEDYLPKSKSPEKASPRKSSARDEDSSDSGLPELPDFFTDKNFFFYGEMSVAERRMLTRYIAAGDGNIEEYMNNKVNYVITSVPWDDNFDDALEDNPNLVFIKPKWVYACHDKNKLLPYQPFVVVPD